MRARCFLPALCAMVTASFAGTAHAGDVQLSAFAGGEGSAWRGDVAGFVGLRLGYRFIDAVGPYINLRAGYANTNQRILELLQIGVQAWARIGFARPYARFGFVHQHEEPWAGVQNDLFGALFGVGDGITHRGGFEGAIGVDLPFKQMKSWQFHGTLEGFCTGFPDHDKGPTAYGGGIAGLGFNYSL